MKVIVREVGSRPPIMTAARMNAPQGARALADIMAEEEYADICTIDLQWQSVPPAMTVYTVKFTPKWAPENLQHFWPIDIEDAFGNDLMTNELLRDINSQIRQHFQEMTELREKLESQGKWHRPGENRYYM